jgi:hypothetical protein
MNTKDSSAARDHCQTISIIKVRRMRRLQETGGHVSFIAPFLGLYKSCASPFRFKVPIMAYIRSWFATYDLVCHLW